MLCGLTAFEAQLPGLEHGKPDFVDFTAGLMLRKLIGAEPAHATHVLPDADGKFRHASGPGSAFARPCASTFGRRRRRRNSIARTDCCSLGDLTCWRPFKANLIEDINLALGFFDRFAGAEPNWLMPTMFRAPGTNQSSDTNILRRCDAETHHRLTLGSQSPNRKPVQIPLEFCVLPPRSRAKLALADLWLRPVRQNAKSAVRQLMPSAGQMRD